MEESYGIREPYPSSQFAIGGPIAQSIGGHALVVNIGMRPDEVAQLLQATTTDAMNRIDELAKRLNISTGAVEGFFSILRQENPNLEELTDKLALIAHHYLEMIDRLPQPLGENPIANTYLRRAQELLRSAQTREDYVRADALLREAQTIETQNLQRDEIALRERTMAVRQRRL